MHSRSIGNTQRAHRLLRFRATSDRVRRDYPSGAENEVTSANGENIFAVLGHVCSRLSGTHALLLVLPLLDRQSLPGARGPLLLECRKHETRKFLRQASIFIKEN